MNKPLALLLGAASLLAFSTTHAILITDFGSGSFSPYYTDFAANPQTPSQITLDGTEGNMIFGNLSAPVNILGSTEFLTISGIYTGSYNGQFVIELFDADNDSLTYNGFYANFTPGVLTTVNLVLVLESGSFNGIVTSVGFTAGFPGGSASVDLVASNLSAVPEPASSALAAASLTALLTFRRRQV
jgi:hypothetical protein